MIINGFRPLTQDWTVLCVLSGISPRTLRCKAFSAEGAENAAENAKNFSKWQAARCPSGYPKADPRI